MKKQILLSIVVILLVVSCKKEATTKPETSTPLEEIAVTPSKTECYLYEKNGNKIELKVEYYIDTVAGNLTYAFAGKDKNVGTYKGKIENNILIADYTFQSEGKESVRQIAFQLKEDKMIAGYGDVTEDGNSFKDITKLKFDPVMSMDKVVCPE